MLFVFLPNQSRRLSSVIELTEKFQFDYVRSPNSNQSNNNPTDFKKQVRGKQRTVLLILGQEKLSYSIFSLVLHSARNKLAVTNV